MKTNSKRRDYHRYEPTVRERVWEIGKAAGAVGFLAYFFYRSVWAVIPLAGIGVIVYRRSAAARARACREQLVVQFQECILSVSTALKAGYAVENAFVESRNDMRLLYGEDSLIYQELETIRRGLVVNISLEEQLTDLAERSDSEDLRQFAQVFAIAKRSGGNLPEIIRSTAELIGQRISMKQEIRTLLSGRRLEQTIMKLMPFGILMYIGVSYPGYFDSLYHNLTGIAVMTGCLGLYLAAYVIGDRTLDRIARDCL